MPRSGGESDKLGNHFEAVWTVDAAIDVLTGRFKSITVEAFGDDSQGVEFHLENLDGTPQFHSVKRQKQGGDWSIAALCSSHDVTGRCILGDFFNKRRKHPGAQFRFVSATGANELRELCERANNPANVADFMDTIPPKLQTEFDKRIVPLCGNSPESAFDAVEALEVIPRGHQDLIRSVERRIDELFCRNDRSTLNPGDVRRLIAEFFVQNLGPRIDASRLHQLLDANGIGLCDWKANKGLSETVAANNRRYLSVVETELINRTQIAREVVAKIIAKLSDAGSRGVLLVAPGGFGKSCVVAQCMSQLEVRATPYLCLRMDALQPCVTARQLGNQLDLDKSPAVVLAGLANNAPSVLIVDQLDAMSLVSGRNPRMWQVFQELCDEVRSYPHMRMILACRDFDLKHDHRLRSLGEPHSGFTTIPLEKLGIADIQASLNAAGCKSLQTKDRQFEILGVPFHLLLFLQGDPTRNFTSVGELYDRYWERKHQSVRDYLGREPRWNEVIDALTHSMSEQQVLFAPKVVTDGWPDDAKAMASAHVLVEAQDQRQYRFFHESFFDYAYARRFCASGRSLLSFLESTEQHLFRRAQVRQILAYRRENQFGLYLSDVRDVCGSPKVRFHLKRMVASEFGRLHDPKPEEWDLIEARLLDGDLSRYLCAALRDHVGWFDLLDSLHVFERWLASKDAGLNNAAIWFLESRGLHDSRSARIAQLIGPYAKLDDPDWRAQVMRIMSWGQAHKSQEMAAIYLDMVSRGVYADYESSVSGSDFWSQHYEAEKEAPRFIIDVLAVWFDRVAIEFDDGESWNFFDRCPQNRSHTGAMTIGKAAANEPEYFVETMLPRVAATILRTEACRLGEMVNRAWPYLNNQGDAFDINDGILLSLRRSLQFLAKTNPHRFRRYAATITAKPHQTFGYLLLTSRTENPREFANECAEYLIADKRRQNIGYGSWSGGSEGTGESAISRTAIKATSPYFSAELFQQLEETIIGYYDQYERKTPSIRGYAELLILRSLDASRISQRTRLRIEELERKFPNLTDAIVQENTSDALTAIESPIAPDKALLMTDSHWISAMRKYPAAAPRCGGGAVELSRLLCDFAQKDRARFASLALQMPDDLDAVYFSAILDGLCARYLNLSKEEKEADKRILDGIPTKVFLDVIERLHALPSHPCGSAISACIGMLSKRQLPKRALEIVAYYATCDPDPDKEEWQAKAGNNRYHGGDPYTHGINCVRGQAAQAIGALLFDDHSRLEDLRPAISALARDPIISVRTCAIRAMSPLLNVSRDLAVEQFLIACDSCESICASRPFDHFVHYAVHTHYAQLRDLLQFALNSSLKQAVENASRQIIVAELEDVDVGTDAAAIRAGNESMRRSAASVYARNLKKRFVGDKCAERLEEFFGDDAKSVREQVSGAFFRVSGERLLQLKDFIARYIESKCFETETYRLIHALEESNVQLPEIVGRAAERILDFLGKEGANAASHGTLVAHTLATLIIRQYEQTTDQKVKTNCLDLIDRMEQVGYLGMTEELNKIDR